MIFVTVGSQKFQFNRLLQKIDELVTGGVLNEEIFAQIGCSDYKPVNYKFIEYLNKDEFESAITNSEIVITHGGTATIIKAVNNGKKTIVVPRLAKYGEHVDDHQLQLLEQFAEMDIICACIDIDNLAEKLKAVRNMNFTKYRSNTKTIINSIEHYLENNLKNPMGQRSFNYKYGYFKKKSNSNSL